MKIVLDELTWRWLDGPAPGMFNEDAWLATVIAGLSKKSAKTNLFAQINAGWISSELP